MFWNVLRMESDKIFKRAVFWIELAVLALIFILVNVVAYLSVNSQSPAMQGFIWPNSLSFALSVSSATSVGGILMVILVGLVTAQEYSWRTMQLWLSNGVSRKLLIGVKAVSLLMPVVGMILASVFIGGALSALLSLFAQGTVHAEHVNFIQLLLSCLVEAYTMFPYLALTFAIAIMSRSALLAVSLGLIYTIVVESVLLSLGSLVKGIFAQMAVYLPSSLAKDVLAPFLSSIATPTGAVITSRATPPAAPVSPALAAIYIGFYTLVLAGIAAWTFSRQDMTN
jgi:ABC-2 type transport system permease protein